jgi:hypothetical protein
MQIFEYTPIQKRITITYTIYYYNFSFLSHIFVPADQSKGFSKYLMVWKNFCKYNIYCYNYNNKYIKKNKLKYFLNFHGIITFYNSKIYLYFIPLETTF